jgi:hypothetical protein
MVKPVHRMCSLFPFWNTWHEISTYSLCLISFRFAKLLGEYRPERSLTYHLSRTGFPALLEWAACCFLNWRVEVNTVEVFRRVKQEVLFSHATVLSLFSYKFTVWYHVVLVKVEHQLRIVFLSLNFPTLSGYSLLKQLNFALCCKVNLHTIQAFNDQADGLYIWRAQVIKSHVYLKLN